MVPTLHCRVALVPPTPFPKTYNSAGVQGGGERSGQVAGGRRAGGKMGHRAHQAGGGNYPKEALGLDKLRLQLDSMNTCCLVLQFWFEHN